MISNNNLVNHYSEYDPNKQLRPKINTADFYTKTGFDFGWLLLEPINISKSSKNELNLAKRFSPGQKALYFWWYADAQVKNGGFIQFYSNGYENYVPAIIEGLSHIGDNEMAELILEAHKTYLSYDHIFRYRSGIDLYKDLHDVFETFDKKFYQINKQTMSLIEKYARQNPHEFCVDEKGQSLEKNYTGKHTSRFSNKRVKEEFYLKNGILDGEFKTYFKTGQIKSSNNYIQGEQLGEQKEWYENGNIKTIIVINPETKEKVKKFYFENGQISKLKHTDAKDEKKGDYKKWYPNGQLKESLTYTSQYLKTGEWLKFWEDGSKKLEAEFNSSNGGATYKNYWDESGNQLLKDGTGVNIEEYKTFNSIEIHRTEYKNYLLHGISEIIEEGRVTFEQEYQNGKLHGITRSFYDNGLAKEISIYENGIKISSQKMNKRDYLTVKTLIECEMEDKWLKYRNLELADKYPVVKNAEETALFFNFGVDKSFFDNCSEDTELSCKYFVYVDSEGKVTGIEFLIADNEDIITKVGSSIGNLIFEPAIKDGTPTDSYVFVNYTLRLEESDFTNI